MKSTEIFSTEVDYVRIEDRPFAHQKAKIGWALEIGCSEDGVKSIETNILTIHLDPEEDNVSVPVQKYEVECVHDYCIGVDNEMKPSGVVILEDQGKIQINF